MSSWGDIASQQPAERPLTAAAAAARRKARIEALTGHQRQLLLAFLCGYAPQAVDAALDELTLPRIPFRPSAG